jgi:hypothetical protein
MIELNMEQGSIAWHKARTGIVTSTKLKSAVGTPAVQQTLLYELLADRMAEKVFEDISSAAMAHGNETEDMARLTASKALGLDFEPIGMLVSDIVDDYGISPDGVYRRDGKIVGGIEIKCPNSRKHIEYMIKGEVPKEYFHQTRSPFVLSDDIEFWIFMSFDYRNYNQPEFYIKIERDDVIEDVKKMREKLSTFNRMVKAKHFDMCLNDNVTTILTMKEGN